MNSHRFKLYRAYSISLTSSNVGKCFCSLILKDCIKVQGKKRKLLSCVPVLDKTWIQALSRCSRATTAKKCTKKAWCTCKVVVLLIKPIAFLPFSLPSASSLLKLPIRELKHLRRRQGQRQKNNWFYEQNICSARASRFLVHFFHVHCTIMTWNLPMRRFVEDVDIRRQIVLSLFELG